MNEYKEIPEWKEILNNPKWTKQLAEILCEQFSGGLLLGSLNSNGMKEWEDIAKISLIATEGIMDEVIRQNRITK